MIFAVSLALTTLFITLNSISLPYNAVSSLASCLNLITSASDPVNPFPTLTRPFAPHATVSAVPSDIHTYNRGASEQPYNVIPHSVSVAPSETVMHIVPDPELCISISPSALDCLFFVTLSFAILSYCLLTTSSSKHGPVADVPASLTESHVIDKPERSYEGYREGSTESDAPLKEKRETFERYVDSNPAQELGLILATGRNLALVPVPVRFSRLYHQGLNLISPMSVPRNHGPGRHPEGTSPSFTLRTCLMTIQARKNFSLM